MTTRSQQRKIPDHSSTWVTLVFIYLYLVWGGTYLAVHFAIESIPPFFLAGTRFLVAGGVLMAILGVIHSKDFHWGNLREWKDAAIVGCLVLVLGIGTVNWAQQYISSSIAALIVGSIPFFTVLFDWLSPQGRAPSLRTCIGLILGFIGLYILLQPSGHSFDTRMEILGKLATLGAAASWSAGAIYSRHVHAKGSPLLPMARQMIVAGALLSLLAVVHGDCSRFSVEKVTWISWIAYGYLVTFGSLLGFTAYIWLMRVSTTARVSTIPYMNLVVAVLLGWTLGREPMTPHIALGAVIVVGSVILVLKKKKPKKYEEPPVT